MTIVKNPPGVLRELDCKLSWLKQYFKQNPQDFDKFDAALNAFTFMGAESQKETKDKFLNIFRHIPYEDIDYASDLIENE